MALIHITSENFKDFIASDELVVVDFWATWCGPCRMLTPVLEDVNDELGIKIGKINVDEEEALASVFNVSSIPTILLFKNSKIVAKHVGYMPYDDMVEWISENK